MELKTLSLDDFARLYNEGSDVKFKPGVVQRLCDQYAERAVLTLNGTEPAPGAARVEIPDDMAFLDVYDEILELVVVHLAFIRAGRVYGFPFKSWPPFVRWRLSR